MPDRNRFLFLVISMSTIILCSTFIARTWLYHAAQAGGRMHLAETALTQAKLSEAVAQNDQAQTEHLLVGNPNYKSTKATLSQNAVGNRAEGSWITEGDD